MQKYDINCLGSNNLNQPMRSFLHWQEKYKGRGRPNK
jgi:hypothetical protein